MKGVKSCFSKVKMLKPWFYVQNYPYCLKILQFFTDSNGLKGAGAPACEVVSLCTSLCLLLYRCLSVHLSMYLRTSSPPMDVSPAILSVPDLQDTPPLPAPITSHGGTTDSGVTTSNSLLFRPPSKGHTLTWKPTLYIPDTPRCFLWTWHKIPHYWGLSTSFVTQASVALSLPEAGLEYQFLASEDAMWNACSVESGAPIHVSEGRQKNNI